MTHARAAWVVAVAHALLLAAAWRAGLPPGDGRREATPLQVVLLAAAAPAAPMRTALPVHVAPALPAMPVMPAPPVVPIATVDPAPPAPVSSPAPGTAAPPRAPEASAPPALVEPPVPVVSAAADPVLTQARADHQRCPPAAHPAALRERGIEGTVRLRVRVGADGLPTDVHVAAGSGWALMDRAALAQARGCRFLPARRGSEAVESWVEYAVRFVLNG